MKKRTKLMAGLAAMLLASGSAIADTFYLQQNFTQGGSESTIDKTLWFNATTGGDNMDTLVADFVGNDFDPQSFQIRNIDTANFDGTIQIESGAHAVPIILDSASWQLNALNVNTDTKIYQATPTTFQVNTMNMSSSVLFRALGSSGSGHLDLSFPILTGAGDMSFGGSSYDAVNGFSLSVTDGTGYTGSIEVIYGPLDLASALNLSSATLEVGTVEASTAVVISNDATFDKLNHGGVSVAAGTYTAAELNTATSSSKYSGSGSITVLTVPPPETFYLQDNKSRNDEDTIKTIWFDALTSPNGTNMDTLGANFAGNLFDLNGFSYQTRNSTGTYTFGGTMVNPSSTLAIYSDGFDMAGLDWTAVGSDRLGPQLRMNKSNVTMNIGSLSVSNKMVVRVNATQQNLDLSVSDLTGDGTISFGTDNTLGEDGNSVWGLDVDSSSFTGTIELNVGILQFNDTLSMPDATLQVLDGSQITSVVLSNSATFSEMKYGNTTVLPGTYTAAQLNSDLGTDRFSGAESITVLTDGQLTFYLQGNKANNVSESEKSIWFDDPTAPNATHMGTLGADFAGNLFEMNGYNYYSKGSSLAAPQTFGGTLIKGDSTIAQFCPEWVVAALHVTAASVTADKGLLSRKAGASLTVTDFQLDGLLLVRDNNGGYGLNLSVTSLTGAGTLAFGRDNDETDNVWGLVVGDDAFTGTIDLRKGDLQFNAPLSLSNATLQVEDNAFNEVILSNDAAFAAMTYDGSTVPDGAYIAADLNTLLSTTRFSGAGTLTVGTPPSGPTDADHEVSNADFDESFGYDGTSVSGSFAGFTGGSYTVEWTSDLTVEFVPVPGTTWPVIGTGTSGGSGVAINWSYDPGTDSGFFRLVVE